MHVDNGLILDNYNNRYMYIYIYISADLLNLSHSWSLINEIKYAPSDVPLSLSILTWPCWFFALFRPDHPHPKLTDNSSQSQNSVKVFHFPMQWKAGCGVRVSSSSSWGQAGSYLAPNEPVIDKSVDYRAFCLQTTTKRKIKIFAQ